MGHSTHFLSRLNRVSMHHADMALGLYRDPKFIRAILGEFRDLDAGDRAAIALGDEGAGPYVVVAVDGGFVTCLGKEMKPRGLYVIRREFIEARMKMHADYRAGWERFDEMAENGEAFQLLEKVIRGAHRVSREDIEQIACIVPALQYELITGYHKSARYLRDNRDWLIGMLQSTRKQKRGHYRDLRYKALEDYWQHVWLVANVHVLATMNGTESLMVLGSEAGLLSTYHVQAISEGLLAVVLRALWGAGVRGKMMLDAVRDEHHLYEGGEEMLGLVLSITVAALRHPELEEEARELGALLIAEHPGSADLLNGLVQLMDFTFKAKDIDWQGQKEVGWQLYLELRAGLEPSHPDFYRRPEDAPENLLRTCGALLPVDYRQNDMLFGYLFYCLPWIARASATDLFLPRSLVEADDDASDAEHAEILVGNHVQVDGRFKTHKTTKRAGRNAPCPCDSGKKYKRCCEAEDREKFYVID